MSVLTRPGRSRVQIGPVPPSGSRLRPARVGTLPEGPRGLEGVEGSAGPAGPAGPEGPEGPQGDIGPAGASGIDVLITGAGVALDTGTKTAWAPLSGASNTAVHWSGAADLDVQGISGFSAGQKLLVLNTGTKIAGFSHNHASAAASDKIQLLVTSAPTRVAPGGFILLQGDGTDVQLVDHEQGGWITPTFDTLHYTSSSGTWTVDAGDRVTGAYRVDGKTVTYIYALNMGTITGSPQYLLVNSAAYGGYTPAVTATRRVGSAYDGSPRPAIAQIDSTNGFRFGLDASAAFAANVNTTYMQGDLQFEAA